MRRLRGGDGDVVAVFAVHRDGPYASRLQLRGRGEVRWLARTEEELCDCWTGCVSA